MVFILLSTLFACASLSAMEFEPKSSEKHPLGEENYSYDSISLCQAIVQDNAQLVQKLLQASAPITENTHGITLLDLAVMRRESNYPKDDIILLLLAAGAKLSTQQKSGHLQEFLKSAIQHKKMDLVKQLNTAGFAVKNMHALEQALRYKSNDIAQFIMHEGVSIDDHNDHGLTPLHLAVRYGNVEAVTLLLDQGASVLVLDAEQKTVFHQLEETLKKPLLTPQGREHYVQIFKLCQDYFTAPGSEIDDITPIISRMAPLLASYSLPKAPMSTLHMPVGSYVTPPSWDIYVHPESDPTPLTWFNRRTRYAAFTAGGVVGAVYAYYCLVDFLSRHNALT